MSERRNVSLRVLFLALIVANVMFFAYAYVGQDTRTTAAMRIEELQINPGRITLKGAATRGPGGQAVRGKGASSGPVYRACLEWGPFTAADAARAESALAELALPQAPVQRPVGDAGGGRRLAYFIREPDAGTVARIAELQRAFAGTEIKAGPCPFS